VAWVGKWDVDLARVRCPVLLWYGEEDRFASMANGEWLRAHLADARLVRRPGEGHFGIVDHLAEMLTALSSATATPEA
jgi:pimeloyl-ACP methyl ester carboxylesterase